MKKTFQLSLAGKHPDRVLDAIKHEIRQYIKRERAKALPEGADFWDFDCQLGPNAEQAQAVHPAALLAGVDALASQGLPSFHLVLLAKPATRQRRPVTEAPDAQEQDPQD